MRSMIDGPTHAPPDAVEAVNLGHSDLVALVHEGTYKRLARGSWSRKKFLAGHMAMAESGRSIVIDRLSLWRKQLGALSKQVLRLLNQISRLPDLRRAFVPPSAL